MFLQLKRHDLLCHTGTYLKPVDPKNATFIISKELDTSADLNITLLNNLAPDLLVTIKAEVCAKSNPRTIYTQNKRVNKQEIIIRDEDSSIKLILWEVFTPHINLQI